MRIEVNDAFDKSEAEAALIEGLLWYLGKAESLGLVVTVDRKPLLPLAMGNHAPVLTVRRARSPK